VSISGKILEDHALRKDGQGTAWFDAKDLDRLGITGPVMTVMQDVQHILRSSHSEFVVETSGNLDRFSVRSTR
jgi:hypothetical protein